MAHFFRLTMKHPSKPKTVQIFTINVVQIGEMLNMKKSAKNVNKREFFKKLFCTWKYKPKATSYATFKIFHQYLLQKLNFIRIHVKFDPKWFPSPGACQGHFFQPLLWPMVGTIIGTYIFGKIAEFLSFAFSKLSRSVAQFLLMWFFKCILFSILFRGMEITE